MGVLLWTAKARHNDLLIGQDYSIEIGFWQDGPYPGFCEQGTGHGFYERIENGNDEWMPTHWMPLPDAPIDATGAHDERRA